MEDREEDSVCRAKQGGAGVFAHGPKANRQGAFGWRIYGMAVAAHYYGLVFRR